MATPSDRTLTRDLLARLRRHYIKPGARPAGVDCSASGRIPADVRAAYDAAHTSTSDAGVTTLPQAS